MRLYVPPPGESSRDESGTPAAIPANHDLFLPFSEPFRSKVARWAKRGITKWEQEGSCATITCALRKMARHYSRSGLIIPDRYQKWIARNEPDEGALRRQRTARGLRSSL